MVVFCGATVIALLALIIIYVCLPWLGIVFSPSASYGLIIVTAIYFSAHVLLDGRLALLYAPLFILLATSVLPQSTYWNSEGAPPEYYWWAVGLFLITCSLMLKLPWDGLLWRARRRGVPRALVIFLVISVAAALQGLHLGYSLSYVARQFFGVALFIVYFYAAILLGRSQSQIEKYFSILKWSGIAITVYMVVHFSANAAYHTQFKWGVGTYCAMLSVYCMAEAATAEGFLNRLIAVGEALVLIVNPIAFQGRSVTGFAAVASALIFFMLIKSRKTKALLLVGTLVLAFAAVTVNFIAPVDALLPHVGEARSLIPGDILTDTSFIGRANQLLSAINVIAAHPLLGRGLGSTLTAYDPSVGMVTTVAMVDQGFAYILSKMGLLGFVAFYALAFSIFRHSGWPEKNRIHLAMFALFAFNMMYVLTHPALLQFIEAGFGGITAGILWRSPTLRATPGLGTGHGAATTQLNQSHSPGAATSSA